MEDLVLLEHISELCATNRTAADLCRSLVHSPAIGKDAVGAAIFLTTLSGDIELIGSYGRTPDLGSDHSIWANNPIANAIREQASAIGPMPNGTGDEFPTSAIPILKGSNPIGAICMMRTSAESMLANRVSPIALKGLGNTMGIWVDSLGVKPATGPVPIQSAEELTDRQLEILRQMAAGRTNAQIAAELILSESSIRQETVRIYRALGVGTRAEAARKGLNLGLIDKVAI